MNLLKHAKRVVGKVGCNATSNNNPNTSVESLHAGYGVRGSESAFSSSVEALNNNPHSGLMGYDMYIRENRLGLWSQRKGIYMEYYNGVCQVCKWRKAITLHHMSYAHLGKEAIAGEVVLICKVCHARAHQKEIEGRR